MRALSAAFFLAACLCLAVGGVLLVHSRFASQEPAEFVAVFELPPDARPEVENDAVLVLRNTGGRAAKLLDIPDL